MWWPSLLNGSNTSIRGVGRVHLLFQKFLLITPHSPRKTTRYFRAKPDVNKLLYWERFSANRTNSPLNPARTLPFPFFFMQLPVGVKMVKDRTSHGCALIIVEVSLRQGLAMGPCCLFYSMFVRRLLHCSQ